MKTLQAKRTLNSAWDVRLDDYVIALQWSTRGAVLAAGLSQGSVVLLDAETGQPRQTFDAHAGGLLSLRWSPDGSLLVTGGQDGRARIWDSKGKLIHEMSGGAAWVEHLSWSPDGSRLATTAGRIVRLWTSEGVIVGELPPHSSTVAGVTWRGDGRKFATISYGNLCLWRGDRLSSLPEKMEWKGSLIAIEWSPNGQVIACGCQDASVHVWYAKNGKDLEMTGYPIKVRALSWDGSSRYLATGGSSDVTVWDFTGRGPAGSTPIVMESHKDFISVLAFQHNGPLIASGARDGTIRLWDVGAPKTPPARGRHVGEVTNITWNDDDDAFATSDANGHIAAWSVE